MKLHESCMKDRYPV